MVPSTIYSTNMILMEIWFSWEAHKSSCTGLWWAGGWGHWKWHAVVPREAERVPDGATVPTATSGLSGAPTVCAAGAVIRVGSAESGKKRAAFTPRCALPCMRCHSFFIVFSFEVLPTHTALNWDQKKHEIKGHIQVELTEHSVRVGLRALLKIRS